MIEYNQDIYDDAAQNSIWLQQKKKEKPLREKLNIWAPRGSQGNECDVSIRDTEG